MIRLAFAAGCIAAFAFTTASAQDYPTRPVTLITPAAAGNSPDVATRVVADKLSQMWKQQVVVINRPGAGGLIAAQAAAASSVEKDGYTLYMTQASTYTVLPIMQEGKMGVDLHAAFTPIAMLGEQPIAVAVNKEIPANTIAELIAYAATQKDPVLFGATNRGGQSHLTGELFRERSKANISFVHAASASVSVNDLLAGRIPMMFEGLAGLGPALQSDSVKLLGIASIKRVPNMPNLPTMSETVPGVVSSGWIVLMAPKGVPDAIIQKINADIRKVVVMPDVVERFQALGTYSRDLTPAQTAEFIDSEEKLWWPIVRDVNKAQGVKP
jgi:tripartite-type tricarboxylate transporter receptor subunit TctC